MHLLSSHDNSYYGAKNSVILRLAHLYEAGEDPVLSRPASVTLDSIFSSVTISSCTEMSVTANQPVCFGGFFCIVFVFVCLFVCSLFLFFVCLFLFCFSFVCSLISYLILILAQRLFLFLLFSFLCFRILLAIVQLLLTHQTHTPPSPTQLSSVQRFNWRTQSATENNVERGTFDPKAFTVVINPMEIRTFQCTYM